MKIGVVSDTHDNTPNVIRIVDLFNAAGVDLVIHTGDITMARTLDVMAGLRAPMMGVFGNNDTLREELECACARHGFSFGDPPLTLSLGGREIAVVHDPRDFGNLDVTRFDLLLHGHVHSRVIDRRENRLQFNPGECAGMLPGRNAVGVVELGSLKPDLLLF